MAKTLAAFLPPFVSDPPSPGAESLTLYEFLTALYQDEYTGLIVLHCHQGVPKKVEFPGVQLALQTGRKRAPE